METSHRPEDRKRFLVTGRVQGVGFRDWTRRRARELGLRGTVMNRPDGGVEVEAAGSPIELDRLRALLQKGPPFAHVTNLSELEPGSGPLPEEFRIEGY